MSDDIEILYQEPTGFVGLSWSKEMNCYVMHTQITVWSTSEYKRYIEIFGRVLDGLYKRGIKEVYGLCGSHKKLKFNELFGFKYTGTVIIDDAGVERFLSRLEI